MGCVGKTNAKLAVEKNTLLLKELNFLLFADEPNMK
jgi:hypothetical protein